MMNRRACFAVAFVFGAVSLLLWGCGKRPYLQSLQYESLAPSTTPRPVRDIPPFTLSLHGDIGYHPTRSQKISNGQHSPVSASGEISYDTFATNNYYGEPYDNYISVSLNPADTFEYAGYNITHSSPAFTAALGLDYRIVRWFSVGGELHLSGSSETPLLLNLLVGPSFHYYYKKLGGRIGVNLGFMNYKYAIEYLTDEGPVINGYEYTPPGDYWLMTESKSGVRPYFNGSLIFNTLTEPLLFDYYANASYNRIYAYSNREGAGRLKVRLSYFSLTCGIMKKIGKFDILAGGGIGFENAWDLHLDTLLNSHKLNESQNPLFPQFHFQVSHSFIR